MRHPVVAALGITLSVTVGIALGVTVLSGGTDSPGGGGRSGMSRAEYERRFLELAPGGDPEGSILLARERCAQPLTRALLIVAVAPRLADGVQLGLDYLCPEKGDRFRVRLYEIENGLD